MNEEQMRKEFEEWAVDNLTPFGAKLDKHEEFDAYIDGAVTAYFMAWKASRESMKAIKLPDSKIYRMAQHGMTQMIDLNDTKDAITSAGYKVEE